MKTTVNVIVDASPSNLFSDDVRAAVEMSDGMTASRPTVHDSEMIVKMLVMMSRSSRSEKNHTHARRDGKDQDHDGQGVGERHLHCGFILGLLQDKQWF